MNIEISSDGLALWGAVLSSCLAIVKFWEMWRDRVRLDIGYSFSSNPDIANSIIIRNLSSKSVIVTFVGLGFFEKKNGRWVEYMCIDDAADVKDFTLHGNTSKYLDFHGSNGFSFKSIQDKRLYLSVNIAGHNKQKRYLVYS